MGTTSCEATEDQSNCWLFQSLNPFGWPEAYFPSAWFFSFLGFDHFSGIVPVGPPAAPFYPVLGEGCPAKWDYRNKVGTLILASLPEDLERQVCLLLCPSTREVTISPKLIFHLFLDNDIYQSLSNNTTQKEIDILQYLYKHILITYLLLSHHPSRKNTPPTINFKRNIPTPSPIHHYHTSK